MMPRNRLINKESAGSGPKILVIEAARTPGGEAPISIGGPTQCVAALDVGLDLRARTRAVLGRAATADAPPKNAENGRGRLADGRTRHAVPHR
jgi:hypothetical protein